MREILFRGKRVDNCEWVCGYYVYDKLYDSHIIAVNEPTGGDGYIEPNYYLAFVNVLKNTVGQFTGLTDKNGVKIFEGDLFEWTSKDIDGSLMRQVDVVRWADGGRFVCGKDYECLIRYLQFDPSYENLELIGNIHDKEV